MLPFLKPKRAASVIMTTRSAAGEKVGADQEQGEQNPELMSIAEKLIGAVHAKDASAVAEALQAAQSLLDIDEEPTNE
jgi:hypothetical protein